MLTEFAHRYIPGARSDGPTLLALHGTGGDENDLLPVARMLDPNLAVLSPRGRVLERGMPRFFRRLSEGVFDLEDLRARTTELAEFIAEASAHYGFDPRRVHALGYSNGANIAANLLLTVPDVLAGGILLRPMMPFDVEHTPELRGKRIFISAGRDDAIVPPALTERLADALRSGGADVTLIWQATGHSLMSREIDDAAQWFVQGNEHP